MTAQKVVAFRLTDAAAKRLMSKIADNSANVIFTEHAVKQMKKRKITRTQVIDCLKKGRIVESPFLDRYGMWKVTVERYSCGETIGCGVAIDNSRIRNIVITAFRASRS
ncbi:DUF4258 domain-containing protein [Xanthomonas albilineans]|nr:DUF4258 domain-containing protein [Xanthomonas albilineans]PPU94883.1 DUF4258 domain-containing protein [Xanthomonas albilineans]QHQ27966.1 hypothetical protein XaFJ1_GM001220 [Xanthomonas albilineans]